MTEHPRPYLPPPWPDDGLTPEETLRLVRTGQAIDMQALLERATADCEDSSDLEAFCGALIRRIITLETAARALIDLDMLSEYLGGGERQCRVCDQWLNDRHDTDCPVGRMAAVLGVAA